MDSLESNLIPLDEQEDIKQLLIYFALFAINFERMVNKLIILIESITNQKVKDKTAGGYITQVDNLFKNNLQLREHDDELWTMIRKRLWKLNEERIKLLKGLKYYQLDIDGKGARFISYKREEDSSGHLTREEIALSQIHNLYDECKILEDVICWMTECFKKGVYISNVITEIEGKFEYNLSHLNK